MTPEWNLQKKIIDFLEKQHDCYCLKLIKTNKNWIADLLVLVWNWKCFFIEVKTKTGKASELQLFRKKEIENLWYTNLIVYWYEDFIEKFMLLTM